MRRNLFRPVLANLFWTAAHLEPNRVQRAVHDHLKKMATHQCSATHGLAITDLDVKSQKKVKLNFNFLNSKIQMFLEILRIQKNTTKCWYRPTPSLKIKLNIVHSQINTKIKFLMKIFYSSWEVFSDIKFSIQNFYGGSFG
jgi:hypothetical protein